MKTVWRTVLLALAVVSTFAIQSCGATSTSCGPPFGQSDPTVKSGSQCATCSLLLGQNITDSAVCQRAATAKQCSSYENPQIGVNVGDCIDRQCTVGCP